MYLILPLTPRWHCGQWGQLSVATGPLKKKDTTNPYRSHEKTNVNNSPERHLLWKIWCFY